MVSRAISKRNFAEGEGPILVSMGDRKAMKKVMEYVGFVELLAGALAIAGVVGFVSKYFIAQTHVVEPYVLPTFFLGLLLFFIRPGLEIEKLHYRNTAGMIFWLSFVLSAITSLSEWSWLLYNMCVADAFAAVKINTIGNVILVVLLLTQMHLKSMAKGLSMRSLGGKFEWCGIFVLWASTPALQVMTCLRRFSGNSAVSYSLMTVCLGFTAMGIVLILVGEHEIEEDESQETEPLKPGKIDKTGKTDACPPSDASTAEGSDVGESGGAYSRQASDNV